MMDIRFEDINTGNCGGCPEVMHCLQSRDIVEDYSSLLTDFALDPMHDEHANAMFVALNETGFTELVADQYGEPIEDGTTLIKALRGITAKVADDHSKEVEEMEAEVGILTTDCEGPLKMRATKAGRIITATVCNSPSKPNGIDCENVHTNRQTP